MKWPRIATAVHEGTLHDTDGKRRPLLNYMGKLVRYQLETGGSRWLVACLAEDDVIADRVGLGFERLRRGRSPLIGVQPNVAEVHAENWLENGPRPRL